ncbi:glycosyltransferase [Polaromonas sp. YR568]|uniref:glycosyltransferase n=1 Tax=Polaromonas sp. YR568 TaxID=1855301 RepID=UPI0011134A1E|nr:glycosyltransferase [Polaromonas sp. YR568]
MTLLEGASLFSDKDHARCAAAARRALREFDQSSKGLKLPASVALMARQSAWSHASLVHRLRQSLPPGPWIVRDRNGVWTGAEDWHALQTLLLPRIWDYGLAHRISCARPLFPAIFKRFTYLAAHLARFRSKQWVASSSRKLKNGLHESVSGAGGHLAVFQPTSGGWQDYKALLNDLQSSKISQTFRISPLVENAASVRTTLETLRLIGETFSDPRVRCAWALYAPYFAKTVPAMLGIVAEGSALLRILEARTAVTYEANSWLTAPLMEAAGAAGIKRVVFNHNSQPPSNSPIANSVLLTLLRQRTYNELTDVAAVWSPFSIKAMRGIQQNKPVCRVIPVRLQYPANTVTTEKTRPLRVLHAGNYQNWSDFFPWVAETADEYLNGVEALATAVEHMDGIELIVRVRPKREVDAQTVETRLGHRRNVTVCGIEQDFLEQLAESDVLVAHFSTTVEQALQMGKPVLLWGSTARYQQFPGQDIPPTGRLNDSVYIVRHASALPAMLGAIRDATRAAGQSAGPEAAYSLEVGAPSVDQLASFLVHPTTLTEAVYP